MRDYPSGTAGCGKEGILTNERYLAKTAKYKKTNKNGGFNMGRFARKMLAVMLSGAMMAGLVGCGGSDSAAGKTEDTKVAVTEESTGDAAEKTEDTKNSEEPVDSGKTYRIGYVCKHQLDEFMQTLRSGAEEYAKEIGVDLTFMSSEKHSDVEKQVQLMDDMITQKFDAIILVATDPAALIPSIKKANAADIPVILVNDTIDDEAAEAQGAEYVTYIGTDNYQGGVVGGTFISEKYPDGAKICILSGTVGNPAGDARIDGFVEAISANSKLEVVSNQPTDWSRDQGYSVMQNVLTANPDIDVVYCAADLIALGAAEAITQAGKAADIKVLGFDGSSEILAMAEEDGSCVIGSVAQFPADMSKEAIDACITVLEGGTVEHEINTDVKVLPEQ